MAREKGPSQKQIKQIADKAAGGYTEPGKRPLTYTQATGDIICERIADGQSLREICLDYNMPGA